MLTPLEKELLAALRDLERTSRSSQLAARAQVVIAKAVAADAESELNFAKRMEAACALWTTESATRAGTWLRVRIPSLC